MIIMVPKGNTYIRLEVVPSEKTNNLDSKTTQKIDFKASMSQKSRRK